MKLISNICFTSCCHFLLYKTAVICCKPCTAKFACVSGCVIYVYTGIAYVLHFFNIKHAWYLINSMKICVTRNSQLIQISLKLVCSYSNRLLLDLKTPTGIVGSCPLKMCATAWLEYFFKWDHGPKLIWRLNLWPRAAA